jgi:hypothetical protein
MGSREEEEDVDDDGMGKVRRAANWWGFLGMRIGRMSGDTLVWIW